MAQPTVEELERQLADLESRLPAHSVPARMMAELEDLEEEIERAKEARRQGDAPNAEGADRYR